MYKVNNLNEDKAFTLTNNVNADKTYSVISDVEKSAECIEGINKVDTDTITITVE